MCLKIGIQVVSLVIVLTSTAQASGIADTVFIKGNIITVDGDFAIVEAMAIEGDRFIAVGTDAEVVAIHWSRYGRY